MTKLRERMLQDMQLRGFSDRTHECYIRSVRQLAQYHNKSPDQISEEELRNYFLYVKNVKKWKRATVTISLCGIKFFYTQTLKKQWTTFDLVRPKREKRLPVVLTRDEIQRILACVRLSCYRVCLLTIYSCGLRLTEGCTLKVSDIDGQRMVIHVEQGKGGKDRYTLASPRLLQELRDYWKLYRPKLWLFTDKSGAKPMPTRTVQRVWITVKKQAQLVRGRGIHTLRHYAEFQIMPS